MTPPDFLVPAWRLFADAAGRFPGLGDGLSSELTAERDLGAYTAPVHIAELSEFLGSEGGRIIQAATQAGVGETCSTLLRKIKECVRFADAHGLGYLEAAGVPPLVD